MVRSPVAQFVGVGLLLFVALAVTSDRLTDQAAEEEALGDARNTTYVLAHSVAEPSLGSDPVSGDPGAIDRFDREVLDRLLVDDVRRIKLWAGDGTIVWSDQTELIGEQYALDEEERQILREGGTDAELSDLSDPENRLEGGTTGLVEVYTRVVAPDGTPLLFAAYYSTADIEAQTQRVFGPFRRIMLGSLLVLGGAGHADDLGAVPSAAPGGRRAAPVAAGRDRRLRGRASPDRTRPARRRRPGPGRDRLRALGGRPGTGSRGACGRRRRSGLGTQLVARTAVAAGGDPPARPRRRGLAAALDDLVAPAAAAGMTAHVSVAGVAGAPDRAVRLVWRVAQEAVRNALRHSHGSRLDVVVERRDGRIVLVVRDDGVGIDETRRRSVEHLGLRGLAGLVARRGRPAGLASGPGHGTTVTLEVVV